MKLPDSFLVALAMGVLPIRIAEFRCGDETNAITHDLSDRLDFRQWSHAVGERDTVCGSDLSIASHGIRSVDMGVDINDRGRRVPVLRQLMKVQIEQIGGMARS